MANYNKDSHLFKHRVHFKKPELIDLPNGMTDTVLVEDFSRWAAIHKASSNYIQTLDGFNRTTDLVIAIRSQYKDKITFDMEYSVYTVILNDKKYEIRQVDPGDQAEIIGYHLIFLRRKTLAN